MQPETLCNILQRNCTITSTFVLPAEMNIPNHCEFFFDMNRNIEPDEETAKNLKKELISLNICKLVIFIKNGIVSIPL